MSESNETEQFSAARIVKLLENMAFQAGRARRTPDSDAVHDLRVAIRRFSQALTVFKPCFPPKLLKKIRRTLKDMLALAGQARNYDIAIEYLSEFPGSPAESVSEKILARRKESEAALLDNLNRWVRRKSSSKWRAALAPVDLAAGLRGGSIAERATSELTRVAAGFFDSGEKASGAKASAKELHALRLAAKRFRYTLELFAPSYGPAANVWLERIARVQTRLGRINDCRTVRSVVSSIGENREIEAALKRKQRRRMRDFRKLCRDEFADARQTRQWIHDLRFPAKKPAGRSTAHKAGHAVAIEA